MQNDAPIKERVLRRFHITDGQFEGTGIDWEDLVTIYRSHRDSEIDLQAAADFISQKLRRIPEVHSLKTRIKDPEGLIAKIVRKKLEDPNRHISNDNYHNEITDLIGVRALHLLKTQWQPIHKFITDTWELVEPPTANVREGDPDTVIKAFEACGLRTEKHPFGYRSVHYLLKSKPGKIEHVAELQVRTLFEEGWSEIDHEVRYPNVTDNPNLVEILTIFNRIAGTADEMGTFIQTLKWSIDDQTSILGEKDANLQKIERELKETISKLKISEEEKTNLKSQIDRLGSSGLLSLKERMTFVNTTPYIQVELATSPLTLRSISTKTCSKCGKPFESNLLEGVLFGGDKCPACRKLPIIP
jgi:putative GTP pyrophosphokinase